MMSLLGFRKENAEPVRRGWKRQTIRRTRKDIYPGKELQLSTGCRTKHYRKLRNGICTSKASFAIYKDGSVRLEGLYMSRAAKESFARADGFKSFRSFKEFFRKTYGLPFGNDARGAEVIYW